MKGVKKYKQKTEYYTNSTTKIVITNITLIRTFFTLL